MNNEIRRWQLFWLSAWMVLIILSLWVRPVVPIDETRYLSVAWEMWLDRNFLIPHLNGEPYAHKPPLLFWLINLGWSIFGVNEWWPRLVPSIFSLGSIFLTQYCAGTLWPNRPKVALWAPSILLGSFYWAFFTQALMFDMIMAFFTLLAFSGVLIARGNWLSGWGIFALSIGFGILSKGPVILIYTLPSVLLSPLWIEKPDTGWLRWYAAMLAGLTAAAAMALLWALPAASLGGDDYKNAILWGQTAGRLVQSFAHDRPFWWYLPLLPVILSPWLIWGGLWKAVFIQRKSGFDKNSRLFIYWMLLVLVLFSLISGKQPHYLLPLFPAFAIFSARCLDENWQSGGRLQVLLPAILIASEGLALVAISYMQPAQNWPTWVDNISPSSGLALVALAGLMLIPRIWKTPDRAVIALTLTTLVNIFVFLGLFNITSAYNLQPTSDFLSDKQSDGATLAYLGKYHGQFHFLGRLLNPLESIGKEDGLKWAKKNPNGWLIFYSTKPRPSKNKPSFWQPYRSGSMNVLSAKQARLIFENEGGSNLSKIF